MEQLPEIPSSMQDSAEHLLIEPIGDPEGLLGRPVKALAGGGYQIADARSPGCRMNAKEVVSEWNRTFHQEAERVAGFSMELDRLASLKASYNKGVRMETVVTNEKIINADLSGTCGDQVIISVKVGTGRREFQYKETLEGGASFGWKTISASGGGGAENSADASLSWSTPQVWAFTIGSVEDSNQAEISITMPGELTPGQQFEPVINVGKRDLWLIVISCFNEKCVILRPTYEIPATKVQGRGHVKLSPMFAEASAEGGRSEERMIVYGFPEKGDFNQFAPPAGVLSLDASTKYAGELRNRLVNNKEIPARRWTHNTFDYVVLPKSSLGTENDIQNSGNMEGAR